jgi:intron-binding protein aquarius
VTPFVDEQGKIVFSGWSRNAVIVISFNSNETKCQNQNESIRIQGEFSYDLSSFPASIRTSWDDMRFKEVLFLIVLNDRGLISLRGCQLLKLYDEHNEILISSSQETKFKPRKVPEGLKRKVFVLFDRIQYDIDSRKGCLEIYSKCNMLVKRDSKENNSAAILRFTICSKTLNRKSDWIHEIILGYGNFDKIQSTPWTTNKRQLCLKNTLKSKFHIENTLEKNISMDYIQNFGKIHIAFTTRIIFFESKTNPRVESIKNESIRLSRRSTNKSMALLKKSKLNLISILETRSLSSLQSSSQSHINVTSHQLQGILSGLCQGLTLILGAPGTGKTLVLVQLIRLLSHNFPNEKTVIVTSSTGVMHNLIHKLSDEETLVKHLLFYSTPEPFLCSRLSLDKLGQINMILLRRQELLAQVERLGKTMKIQWSKKGSYTCENAGYFWLSHILTLWKSFCMCLKHSNKRVDKAHFFPFTNYFANVSRLFSKKSREKDLFTAKNCFVSLKEMFRELERIRPVEILHTIKDRVDYLLLKLSKIITIPCAKFAVNGRDFIQLGFQYDNLLVIGAEQILELEAVLPIDVHHQIARYGQKEFQRIILIGDHHQIPPVVHLCEYNKYSHFNQSLFLRLMRLGVPYVSLNSQGRIRPSIVELYNWRYRQLANLPNVYEKEFCFPNPGFLLEYQFVDVPNYEGQIESEPIPYFYENFAEADFITSVFQYMCLLGYSARKIVILSTYNGQIALIHNIIENRCQDNLLFGRPLKIATVDDFQGKQSDFGLISLVRTRNVGFLRDVRRFIVALSRCRLGLYIFGRVSLFVRCYELRPIFQKVIARSTLLGLVYNDDYTHTSSDEIMRHISVSNPSSMFYLVCKTKIRA